MYLNGRVPEDDHVNRGQVKVDTFHGRVVEDDHAKESAFTIVKPKYAYQMLCSSQGFDWQGRILASSLLLVGRYNKRPQR